MDYLLNISRDHRPPPDVAYLPSNLNPAFFTPGVPAQTAGSKHSTPEFSPSLQGNLGH